MLLQDDTEVIVTFDTYCDSGNCLDIDKDSYEEFYAYHFTVKKYIKGNSNSPYI